MDVQQQVAADVRLRSKLLPQELDDWKAMIDANEDGMGIHQSQMEAIMLLLDELPKNEDEILAALDPALEPKTFAQRRYDAEQAMSALHGIVAVFRFIFAQRDDKERYRAPLDTADLIAADCYRACTRLAIKWKVIEKHMVREPPLTYLNGKDSAQALTRDHRFSLFKMPLIEYGDECLPISVISLPFHHTAALWTYCSLYHEVGHPLERDFDLSEALMRPLRERLEDDSVPEKRIKHWERWLREIIADAFGVLLGGAGFALSMTTTLLLPERQIGAIGVTDVHPNPYARIFLLGALLRRREVPALTAIADQIEARWRSVYGKPSVPLAFLSDCQAVAEVVLDTSLSTLKNHRLRDFAPHPAADHELIDQLADCLLIEYDCPDPKKTPYRLLPAAAQLAVSRVNKNYDVTCKAIQQRAEAFIAEMERPPFLVGEVGGFSQEREKYLRNLVKNANLRGPASD